MLKELVLLLSLSLTISAAAQAYAGDIQPEIGGQRFSIPAVPGFVDAGTDPALTRIAMSFVEANAKLVAARFRKESPDRYIVVKTPTAIEKSTLSTAEFASIRDSMKKSTSNMAKFGELANAQAIPKRQEISNVTGHDFKDMAFGTPFIINVERDDASGFGYTAMTKIKGNIDGKDTAWNSLMCANALKLKGKLVFVHVYAIHRSQADIDWLRSTCRTFVTSLIAAN